MRPLLALRCLFALLALAVVCISTPSGAQTVGGGSAAGGGGNSGGGTNKEAPLPLDFDVPVVFVLSLGTDATSNADLTVTLAARLARDGHRHAMFLPEGTWTLNDFIHQCQTKPHNVAGAFAILPSSYQSRSDNYLLMIRNSSTITYNGLAMSCTELPTPLPDQQAQTPPHAPDRPERPPTPDPDATYGKPVVEWVSGAVVGDYGHSEIQFLPLAAMTSIYLAFAPQRLYQTTTTHVLPIPPSPIPAGGYDSSVATVSSTTLNSSGTATLQNNVVSAAGVAALLVGRGGTPEHFTVHAAEAAAESFVHDLLTKQCGVWDQGTPPPVASPSPDAYHPQDVDKLIAAAGGPTPSPAPTMPGYCYW